MMDHAIHTHLQPTVISDLSTTLLERLNTLSFEAFEKVMCQVASAAGYSHPRRLERRYTKGAHQGGSGDLTAILSIGSTHVPVLILVKQFKRSIQKRFVYELQGSMLSRGVRQGLIMTLSSFQPGAVEAAGKVVDAPIALLDGPHIAKLLIEHRIGVVEHWTPELAIDDAYFARLEQANQPLI